MDRSFLEKFFSLIDNHAFSVTYWDHQTCSYGQGTPEFAIEFKKRLPVMDMFASPSTLFGEAYMRGDIELKGSFPAIADALERIADIDIEAATGKLVSRVMSGISAIARTTRKQKEDIAAHYDLGNDFFALWLDKSTSCYSCAYFRSDADSLDLAQRQKVDLILKKLQIEPGMRLLDIGCGWGWLAQHAAADYGAQVLGITLSEEQYKAANQRFADNGLRDRAEVRLCNYLELDPAEPFDRIVSVGMYEHVGKAHHAQYFEKVRQLLKPGGLSLLHTLTKNKPCETDPWIQKYIFPGGYIPSIAEVVELLPDYDFHLLHVESLRRHYVKTLDTWHDNFSRPEVQEKVLKMFDQAFSRMWSLYLRMASAYLAIGGLDVHQFLFSRGVNNDLPMTMEAVYQW